MCTSRFFLVVSLLFLPLSIIATQILEAGTVGNYMPAGKGATVRSVQNKLSEIVSVKDFGAKGDGVSDDTASIQNAIDFLQTGTGGTLFFPPGVYITSSTLMIGNGSASKFSTYYGVQLVGAGGGVMPGPGNRAAVTIKSNFAGPAITVQGPIGSWGVENICLVANTNSASGVGIKVVSGQFGKVRNVLVTGFYGAGIVTTTTGTSYLTYHNSFDNVSIYLPDKGSRAVGVVVTGAGAAGGSTGTAFDSWHNLYIVITNSGQVGRVLQYCDNINFYNTEIVNAANGTGTQYNYSSTGINGNAFPSDCRDFGLEVYANSITNYSPSGINTIATPNRIYGFSLTNGATPPNLPNLAVVNESGSSKAVIFLNSFQEIGDSATKVNLDTKAIDNDRIADIFKNHRITPIRKGYYQIDAQITVAPYPGPSAVIAIITQNGSTPLAQAYASNNGVVATAKTSVIAHFNGTTDYVELFGQVTSNSNALLTGRQNTFISIVGPF